MPVASKFPATNHIRNTTLEVEGWVYNDGSLKDISADTFKLAMIYVNEATNSAVAAMTWTQASGQFSRPGDTGHWKLVLAPSVTTEAQLPRDSYWLECRVVPTGDASNSYVVAYMQINLIPGDETA